MKRLLYIIACLLFATNVVGQVRYVPSLSNITTLITAGGATIGGDLTITGDDLYMTTNTTGFILRADGTNYNPTAFTTSAHLASFLSNESGTGVVAFTTSPTFVTPTLGTPAGGTLTSCTGLPIATGISGLGTNVATFLATPSSANLAGMVTGETGTGAAVFGTAPTFASTIAIGTSGGTSGQINFIASDNDQGNVAITTDDRLSFSAMGVDFGGVTRITGLTNTPASGEGLEMNYNAGSNVGSIFCYDRSISGYGHISIGSAGKVGIGQGIPTTNRLSVNGSTFFYADTSSVSDAYGFQSAEITAYVDGLIIIFNAQVANVGACTLQIDDYGALAIKTQGHDDPANDYIEVDSRVMVVFCDESTDYWMLLSPDANP